MLYPIVLVSYYTHSIHYRNSLYVRPRCSTAFKNACPQHHSITKHSAKEISSLNALLLLERGAGCRNPIIGWTNVSIMAAAPIAACGLCMSRSGIKAPNPVPINITKTELTLRFGTPLGIFSLSSFDWDKRLMQIDYGKLCGMLINMEW